MYVIVDVVLLVSLPSVVIVDSVTVGKRSGVAISYPDGTEGGDGGGEKDEKDDRSPEYIVSRSPRDEWGRLVTRFVLSASRFSISASLSLDFCLRSSYSS